ncbi:hypothetical protein [Variovorax guangxiensis]|uniref:Uncharacterized protein n=1 Tax=Variovorax guangxiensis TaxID=1775474 RepID=A0A502E1B6_9BURK|nr:hypothetical protein [Variovorax guangxiensis]TPG26991.1 hypothetical protein EAH83_04430 [Variovorax ginsengisoli]TPG30719.1 hypothetical protein EAH82_04430 [Variovorax guangxiensis]
MKRRIRRLAWILWPSFLLACVVEMGMFALVDPGDVHWRGEPLPLSRQGLYTVAFFVFWVLAMGSSALTALLAMSRREVNKPED